MIASLLLSGLLVAQAPASVPPGHPPVPEPQRPAATATQRPPIPPGAPAGRPAEKPSPEKTDDKDPVNQDQPVVTHHSITVNGRTLKYTATAGMMPLKSATGDVDARMFYIAYTLDNAPAPRPLTFSFNGGPGSSSVWLHLGAIGPRRVQMLDNGGMPAPPFRLVDNESTWLDQTDLVFIDPVGTGYSRATKPENDRNYWGVRQDIDSVGEFIRLYLSRNERWESPLFLVGESYGTFRAAGLAGSLTEKGIALNGVMLISTVLNFGLLGTARGGDLGYALYLPTYAATAWYHKQMPADLQARSLPSVLAEVEQWAGSGYLDALAKGDTLSPVERQAVIEKMARYTGLSARYIDNANLRVSDDRFFKELLRDEKRTVGRYDSRFTGIDSDAAGESAEYDPSFSVANPPFTMTFNEYVRRDLGFKTDRKYEILASVWPWDFGGGGRGGGQQGPPETGSELRSALVQNPYLRVFVAEGYYDLATPYFSVEYTLSHLNLEPAIQSRVTQSHYEAGHMLYLDTPSREKLKRDVSAFMTSALATASPANQGITVAR